MAITMSITMTVVAISWLSLSRSLAIVSMVSVTISKVSISMAIVSISWLGSSGGLSISRSLAIVTMVSITISTIAISMAITMSISMAIVAIARFGNSIS